MITKLDSNSNARFDRVLIIKPSSLGDIIHALPVLNGLRVSNPHAHIAWLVKEQYVELLRGHPQIDELIPVKLEPYKSVIGAFRTTFKMGGFARELRQRDFDVAIDLQGLFRSGLMTWASNAPVRIGFRPAREWAGLFYNRHIPVGPAGIHAVHKNYLARDILGFSDVPLRFVLPVAGTARRSVDNQLQSRGLEPAADYVLVIPGSRWETKNWWPERFSQVIDYVHDNFGIRVVLGGSAEDQDLCQLIAQTCRCDPIPMCGRSSLSELVALVDRARLILCNDSGPQHIALALGTPLVSIFGPTDPKLTGPLPGFGAILQPDLPCSPCFIRLLKDCPIQHECMNKVTVEQVKQVVHVAVQSARSGSKASDQRC